MSDRSRYDHLWRIDPASDRAGSQRCIMPLAQEFVRQQRSENLQAVLLARFQAPTIEAIERSDVG